MAHIYGLYSTRDGKIRYVGETTGDCRRRFEQHRRDAEGGPGRPLHRWFHAEWKEGYPIRWVPLQSCANYQRYNFEREWIRKFPKLLNERNRGWFNARDRKPPDVGDIYLYMRMYRFNVDGFRGVHYSHEEDRYFVLMYNGRYSYLLPGDEIPGEGKEGGGYWFSDLAKAVNARDERRQKYSVNYPADGEPQD